MKSRKNPDLPVSLVTYKAAVQTTRGMTVSHPSAG